MNLESNGARADLKGGAAWIGLGLAILIGAWRMDRFEAMGATLYTAPGLVPGVFGLLLIVLGAALAWRGWKAAPRAAAAERDEALLNRRIAWMLVLCLAYAAVLVGRVPFTAATALFVAGFTWLYADQTTPRRRLVSALASGVLTTLVIVLVFERIFFVRLP